MRKSVSLQELSEFPWPCLALTHLHSDAQTLFPNPYYSIPLSLPPSPLLAFSISRSHHLSLLFYPSPFYLLFSPMISTSNLTYSLQPTSLVSAPVFFYLLLSLFYLPSLLSLPISFFYLPLTPFYLPHTPFYLTLSPFFLPLSHFYLSVSLNLSYLSSVPCSFSLPISIFFPSLFLHISHSLPSIPTFFPLSLYLLYFCYTMDCRSTFILPSFNAQRVMYTYFSIVQSHYNYFVYNFLVLCCLCGTQSQVSI